MADISALRLKSSNEVIDDIISKKFDALASLVGKRLVFGMSTKIFSVKRLHFLLLAILVSEIAKNTKSMWYLALSLITMQLIMFENVDELESFVMSL